ncbi:MAG: hypothetical protein KF873_22925 [Gemmataceae bacterium]|nr:hypothetical protein [Gemmataceae bacterium]
MTRRRISLRTLSVTNGSLPPAELTFQPGLNLVVGASDTGKTFVFETIDFMMGAKDGLRPIPESAGYERVSLSVEASGGVPFTLRRALTGGEFELTEFADGRDRPATAARTLSTVHSPDPNRSLSAYLLHLVGIGNRQVRKNVQGEKKALSFRHVAHLTLIDEERIIQQASPLLTAHDTEHTAEENVFAYFLTGHDDSAIIPQENSRQRKARLATEEELLVALLAERTAELATISVDSGNLADQASRLEASIADATDAVVTTQGQIGELERRRDELSQEHTARQSRVLFLGEQLKRLRLLGDYYRTDRSRLEAVIEAARVVHDMPEGTCPLCNQPLAGGASSHIEFEAACRREVEKIARLQRDLGAAVDDFERETSAVRDRIEALDTTLGTIDSELRSVLVPGTRVAQADLQTLLKTRTLVAQAATLQTTVVALQQRLDTVRAAQAQRVARPVFENRTSTSSASEFCKVVEEILRAWKYPDLGAVAFDTEKGDLVIGGQDRANKGKGYRAITYAAFAIGLMKYCRQKSIPHPGIVVLDTPVNPYKGPTPTNPAERVSDAVKTAFFEYLAGDTSGDQVIVMENEEPPPSVLDRVRCFEFTRNRSVGRYGFFPALPEKLTAEAVPPALPLG